MRGFGFVLGYLLGNKEARDWCIKQVCKASCIIDREVKKTPLFKLFDLKEKTDDGKTESNKRENPIED